MTREVWRVSALSVVVSALTLAAPAAATTYYVSSSAGSDEGNGLSPETAFQTLAKVNDLALVAGDSVLLRCGDTWRAEILRVTRSGSQASPITYGSYPDAACSDRPILSGTQPITGWTLSTGSIWTANLAAGANATFFPNGVNQLFRNGARLPVGRWPNPGQGDQGDGYSTIDGQSGATITDNQLPAANWKGASVHIKGMRWYIMNRDVTARAGNVLTLNTPAPVCWGGTCKGWGYFINNHLAALDQEGEWAYDAAAKRVYLFTTADPNGATIDGSVVMTGESEYMGGIILGRHLYEHVTYVTIDNLELDGWFDNGVTTPVNLEKDEHQGIRLRNLVIRDVDGTGINLATWVWNAAANGHGYNGWRGGKDVEITGCLIERANEFGINSYARQSLISGNTIRDIARIANVGRAGIGCGMSEGEGQCTEPGAGIRLKVDSNGLYSSNNVTVELNRLERLGGNGIQALGYQNALRRNVIQEACVSKGDCGGISLFGASPLASSPVHDVTIQENVILDVIGNTDGALTDYRPLFGFGLYIDNFSRNVTSTGNTIARATAAGILYQNSTGAATGNTLHGNSAGSMWTHQIVLASDATTSLSALTDNVMVGLQPTAGTLAVRNAAQVGTSNRNGFYHSSRAAHISVSSQGQDRTLAQWRSYSGKDASSREWVAPEVGLSQIFVNDQETSRTFPLAGTWLDLDGNPAGSELTLAPFTSRVLIASNVPVATVAGATVVEGHSGTSIASFVVTLTQAAEGTVTVSYETADGSAVAGSDYVATSGELTFAPGTLTRTVSVPVIGDTVIEPNETFSVRLTGASGAAVFGSRAVGTIVNDDPQPALEFKAASLRVVEGTPAVSATVVRSGATTPEVSVRCATANGSAVAGEDYEAQSGTLTFAAGETSKSFSVPILDGTLNEPTETLSLTLSDPGGGAALGTLRQAVVTIVDNDPAGSVQFGAAPSVSEAGPSATVTVLRTGGTASGVTVAYATSDGTARAGLDYQATSGVLTFAAGQTSASFTVAILDDSLGETNETVNLTLSNPGGGAVLGAARTSVLTILENERVLWLPPTVSVSEGAAQATVTLKRSGLMTGSVTVDYATSDGTARAGADYQGQAGTLSFGPGVTSRSFTVPIVNDTIVEGSETFIVRLRPPVGGVLGSGDTAVVTISDNDVGGVVQFAASQYSASESKGSALITVSRTGGAASGVTVAYAASSGTAEAGLDFAAASGTLTFGAGQTALSFPIVIVNDTEAEGAETVSLTLSNVAGGATLGSRTQATFTILDDESTLELAAPAVSVAEGAAASVVVKRTGSLAGTVTVHYATSDGSAVGGTHFKPQVGSLTFAPGVASRTIAIPTMNDTLNNAARTFGVSVDTPTGGAALGHQQTTLVTIADNDPGGVVQFSQAAFAVVEGTPAATITVTRASGSASGVTVDYATADGTARAGEDYQSAAGTLSFGAGKTSATFTVTIVNDAANEGSRTVNLMLGHATGGASLGPRANAVLTINDNDGPTIQFGAGAYAVSEAGRQATVTVTRRGGTASQATVGFSASGGTATAGADYTSVSGTLTFAVGQATAAFAVPIIDDTLAEGDEAVTLRLSTPSGAALGAPAEATLTIRDDDVAGSVQFGLPAFSVSEPPEGMTSQATITVTRTGGTAGGVTVRYESADDTATAGGDYAPVSGTLSFAAGQPSASFTVTVNGDALAEGNEAVSLALTEAGGNARLGATSSVRLWIVEPADALKLVFVHHSTGESWLSDAWGQLGLTLRDNNYFVSDTNYHWGPAYGSTGTTIGDHTDIGHWWDWFLGPSRDEYLGALYAWSGQASAYSRLEDPEPGRENDIVVLNSCFSSSALGGNPADPATVGANPLRGQAADATDGDGNPLLTVANAKGIYNDLLTYFAGHPEKLFIVVTAPPLATGATTAEQAANARAFNDWLVKEWLAGYGQRNVAVFDFFNVLTSSAGASDLGRPAGNHHRIWEGAVEHVHPVAADVSAYGASASDSHPSAAGCQKAAAELAGLLNLAVNRWRGVEVREGGLSSVPGAAVTPAAIAPPGRATAP